MKLQKITYVVLFLHFLQTNGGRLENYKRTPPPSVLLSKDPNPPTERQLGSSSTDCQVLGVQTAKCVIKVI